MTTALYVAMGWLVLCKVAIIALAIRVYSLRGIVKMLADLQEQTHHELASVSGQKDSLDALLAKVLVERQELRGKMGLIAGVIGRRPPRRKWLARARKVAQLAAPVQQLIS